MEAARSRPNGNGGPEKVGRIELGASGQAGGSFSSAHFNHSYCEHERLLACRPAQQPTGLTGCLVDLLTSGQWLVAGGWWSVVSGRSWRAAARVARRRSRRGAVGVRALHLLVEHVCSQRCAQRRPAVRTEAGCSFARTHSCRRHLAHRLPLAQLHKQVACSA